MKKFDSNVPRTIEQLRKAMDCESADEFLKLAQDEGFDMTKEEAEKYFAQLSEINLTPEELKQAAGGIWVPGTPPVVPPKGERW